MDQQADSRPSLRIDQGVNLLIVGLMKPASPGFCYTMM
jgi:hypothetical protein